MSAVRRLVMLFGDRATTDRLRAGVAAAATAAGGTAEAEPFALADEQPVPVKLGKRPGSPYPALSLVATDVDDDARLGEAIDAVLARETPAGSLACWIYRPLGAVLARDPQPPGARHVHLAFTNAVAGREDDYNAWYEGGHMAHALDSEGFATAQRFMLAADAGGDRSPYRYLALYGLRTDDVAAAEAEMHRFATGEKPGMPISDALGPVRATWVYTPAA